MRLRPYQRNPNKKKKQQFLVSMCHSVDSMANPEADRQMQLFMRQVRISETVSMLLILLFSVHFYVYVTFCVI